MLLWQRGHNPRSIKKDYQPKKRDCPLFALLVEPKEATKRIIKAAKKNQVAILFGREKKGWIMLYLFLRLVEC
jgi:hypothetical protein